MATSFVKRVRIDLRYLVVLGLLVWAPLSAMAADTFKIGVLETLSGPFESTGRQYVAAIKFAVDEQNAKGGLLGKKIELITEDHEFKPDVATRRARNLIIGNKINLLSSGASHIVIACNKVATAYRTIHINYSASAEIIRGKEFSRYGFNVCFDSYNIAAALAQVLVTKPYRRLYIINQDYAMGHEASKAFIELLKIRVPDAKIVGEDYHPAAAKDFGPYITKIMATNADAIVTTNFSSDFTNLVKQARSLGLKQPFPFLTLYGGNPYILYELKDDAVGIYHAQMYSMNVKTPENEKMIARYHEQHKNDEDFLTWWPFGSIGQTILGWQMVFAAVEKAGSIDPEKIIETLEGFQYESPVGSWTMRKCDHQVILPMFVGKIEAGTNPYFNGSIRPNVSFPFEGPNIMRIPPAEVTMLPTPEHNPRCK